MKIETEIPDISRDEVIDAMARQLLGEWHDEIDDETGPTLSYRETNLGKSMRSYLDKKIGGLADALVREQFDSVIRDRIVKAVDDVLATGWRKTDEYGGASGPVVDLKARVGEYLNAKDRYSSPSRTFIEEQVKKAVDATLSGEFKKQIDTAVRSLREQLDAAVNGKFVEAVKGAMGVK